MAPLGQTLAQGASSHWRQSTAVLTLTPLITCRRGAKLVALNAEISWLSLCAITQAISQVRQPMHFLGIGDDKPVHQ
jgi:hypothetical protein